jgi:integrase
MTKRRGKKEGGLYRRADGTWCGSFTVGYDEEGRRKRRVVYGKTKTAVQNQLVELQSLSASGGLIDPKRLKVSEYLKHWLEDFARPSVRSSTYASYEIAVRKHIIPYIGYLQLENLQPSHIQQFYRRLEDAKATPRVREYAHVILRRALQQAVRLNLVIRNSCDAVSRPRVPRKSMQCFDSEQAKEFLNAAQGDRFYALYVLALLTGLRQGELFGLQWRDFNLSNSTVFVQRTVYELNGKQEIGEPKTEKSRRRIELPDTCVLSLKAHRQKMLAEGHHNLWVFCDEKGNPLRRSNFRKRSFLKIFEGIDVPKIRFHDLRHTAATLLLTEGVHPKIVQERLGHSQISMTLDTYSHVLPSMQREASAKLDRLFSSS